MYVRYLKHFWSGDETVTEPVEDLVEQCLGGEDVGDRVENVTRYLGRLTNILVEKGVLTIEDLGRLAQSYDVKEIIELKEHL